MLETTLGCGLVLLFLLSTLLGLWLQRHIPVDHRSPESMQLIELVMTLLVTFTAVVLGLLTTSVKTSYDTALHDRAHYAEQLIQLDRSLRNDGPGTDPVRLQLRRYTAGAIASTWPDETRPVGIDYPDPTHMARTGADPTLAHLMNDIGNAIRQRAEAEPTRHVWTDDSLASYRDALQARGDVLDDLDLGVSLPFYCTVVFWLAILFAGFGLRAPANPTVAVVLLLGIMAVTSALVLIIDLDQPYEGLFHVPSSSMRTALLRMSAP